MPRSVHARHLSEGDKLESEIGRGYECSYEWSRATKWEEDEEEEEKMLFCFFLSPPPIMTLVSMVYPDFHTFAELRAKAADVVRSWMGDIIRRQLP